MDQHRRLWRNIDAGARADCVRVFIVLAQVSNRCRPAAVNCARAARATMIDVSVHEPFRSIQLAANACATRPHATVPHRRSRAVLVAGCRKQRIRFRRTFFSQTAVSSDVLTISCVAQGPQPSQSARGTA
jgi:hypothetical protein